MSIFLLISIQVSLPCISSKVIFNGYYKVELVTGQDFELGRVLIQYHYSTLLMEKKSNTEVVTEKMILSLNQIIRISHFSPCLQLDYKEMGFKEYVWILGSVYSHFFLFPIIAAL